jgi:CMP-N,N'-diacetyllegionaminic acid synthase
MNVILIPARGGSKRIPGKNLKLLGGKPLLLWTIEAAQRFGEIVVVSTEDMDVMNLCTGIPGVNIHERSMLAATDVATDMDVVWDFLDKQDTVYDKIIYLRPTTPFRSLQLLAEIIDFQLPVNFSSIRSVQEMPESAFKMFTRTQWGCLNPIYHDTVSFINQPQQLCPKTYQANGYIDILFPKRQFFRRHDIFGPNIYGYKTPATIELDTQEQWDYAEYLIAGGWYESGCGI